MPLKADKKEVHVTIFTERHKVEGTYHMVPDARFSDDLNARQKDFIPLTHVRITDLQDSGTAMESDFLALNKHHIVLFLTQQEPR